jgi:hypothetical protein
MKRKHRAHFRASDEELEMLKSLAADLSKTMTEAAFDAVRFAYLHVDLIVAWNRTYNETKK